MGRSAEGQDTVNLNPGKLHVEVHNGRVIAVWLGCRNLPFQQVEADDIRAGQLGQANPSEIIIAVETVAEVPATLPEKGWDYL